jgi:hypothetical protein
VTPVDAEEQELPGVNPFILASPKTEGHSAKIRLVVTMGSKASPGVKLNGT